jgi:hypothetical protein
MTDAIERARREFSANTSGYFPWVIFTRKQRSQSLCVCSGNF